MDKQWNIQSSEEVQVYKTFESMKIDDKLLRGIFCYGFDKPSAVQQRATMPIISGRDVIV